MRRIASRLVVAVLASPCLGMAADAGGARGDAEPALAWAPWSFAPDPVEAGDDPRAEALLARCGPGERGLMVTAERIAAEYAAGGTMPERGAIAFYERAAGEPYPWPQVWVRRAPDAERGLDRLAPRLPDASLEELAHWLASEPAVRRRCGVATGTARDGTRVEVVLATDALADLTPLPTQARVGEWLDVRARLRVAAHGGRVVVMGPSGAPRALLTSFDGTVLRARFAPDAPGTFAVQVVADLANGPRPVLEATVFADVAPSPRPLAAPAPGEEQGAHLERNESDALAAMVAAARASAGLPAVVRDGRLDAIAHEHALHMAEAQRLAHDAGDGDPIERLAAAGVPAGAAAENVAHESTVGRVHRAIWESPSHRANLLGDYAAMGVAAVRDAHGTVWAVELWSDL